jgi:predicted RecA/RadA family phage recombinase
MKTFVSSGKQLPLTAPVGGVVSGGAYLIGDLLVIAAADAAATESFVGVPVGVFGLPKPYNEDWSEGDAIYFDESAGVFTTDDDSASNPLVGIAVAAVPLSLEVASSASTDDLKLVDGDIDGGVAVIVVDYSALADATITLTINGEELVLTEGVDFDAETSNAVTAVNIAAAINAVPGLSSDGSFSLASNANVANLTIAGGVITVIHYDQLGGKTITVTIDGTDHVLTEGVDFTAETGNNTTATNIAAAIDDLDGVDAAAVSAAVTVLLTEVPIVVTSPSTTGSVRLDGVAR